MPKLLFYAGVAFALVVAALAAVEVVHVTSGHGAAVPGVSESSPDPAGSPLTLIAALIMTFPIAALLVRIASLIASRDLFGAFATLFSVAGATLAVVAIALLRLSAIARASGGMQQIIDLDLIAWQVLGLFLSIALLSTRSFFSLRSPTIGAVVCLPAPIFLGALLQRVLTGSAPVQAAAGFFGTTALSLALIAGYSIRHRHRLLETTSLGDLMTKGFRGSASGAGGSVGIDGGIALDGR